MSGLDWKTNDKKKKKQEKKNERKAAQMKEKASEEDVWKVEILLYFEMPILGAPRLIEKEALPNLSSENGYGDALVESFKSQYLEYWRRIKGEYGSGRREEAKSWDVLNLKWQLDSVPEEWAGRAGRPEHVVVTSRGALRKLFDLMIYGKEEDTFSFQRVSETELLFSSGAVRCENAFQTEFDQEIDKHVIGAYGPYLLEGRPEGFFQKDFVEQHALCLVDHGGIRYLFSAEQDGIDVASNGELVEVKTTDLNLPSGNHEYKDFVQCRVGGVEHLWVMQYNAGNTFKWPLKEKISDLTFKDEEERFRSRIKQVHLFIQAVFDHIPASSRDIFNIKVKARENSLIYDLGDLVQSKKYYVKEK